MIDTALCGKDQPRSDDAARDDPVARGLACLRLGRERAAVAWFQHAAGRDPGNAEAHFMAGAWCLWQGRAAEAIGHLRAALPWAAATTVPAPTVAKGMDPALAQAALFAALDALESAGLQPVLVGGTALGCVREGGFIAHDTDLDLGLAPGADPASVIEAIEAAQGVEVLYHDTWQNQVLRVRFGTEAVGGDIFLYQAGLPGDPGAWWCGVQRGPTAVRWRDSPFTPQPHRFLGRAVRLPGPVERYLEENYGDWQRPDPGHIPALSPPNLVDPTGPMSQALGLRCLCQALREQDHAYARHLCRIVLTLRPGDDAVLAVQARLR